MSRVRRGLKTLAFVLVGAMLVPLLWIAQRVQPTPSLPPRPAPRMGDVPSARVLAAIGYLSRRAQERPGPTHAELAKLARRTFDLDLPDLVDLDVHALMDVARSQEANGRQRLRLLGILLSLWAEAGGSAHHASVGSTLVHLGMLPAGRLVPPTGDPEPVPLPPAN